MGQDMDAKKIFKNAMVELMQEMSFEEITVQKLLDKSTLSRSTFYRYFKDKYDLLNWYYQSRVLEIFETKQYHEWIDYLKEIYTMLGSDLGYFSKALAIDCTNSFYDFLYEFSYRYIKEAYCFVKQTETIENRAKIEIGYIAIGQTHMAKMWVTHGAKESVDDMALWAYELIPKAYRNILDKACVSSMDLMEK